MNVIFIKFRQVGLQMAVKLENEYHIADIDDIYLDDYLNVSDNIREVTFSEIQNLPGVNLKKYEDLFQKAWTFLPDTTQNNELVPALPDKDVKITSEGLMKGNYCQIKITGIKDENLYDTEIAVLNLFGRKKQGQ